MSESTTATDPIAAAADAAIEAAGGTSKLAAALGLGPSAVSNWRKDGIPPARVPAVSRITGIPMENLRPDIYGAKAP